MSFEKVISHILDVEGRKYSNRKADRGGPTHYGITQKTLSAYRGYPCSAEDVKSMTEGEAKAIYRAMYWDEMNLDGLPYWLSLALMDQGVNRGPKTAVIMLQLVLGAERDGVLGPITKGLAIGQDQASVVWAYMKEAQRAYVAIAKSDAIQLENLNGWLNRVNAVLQASVLANIVRPLK